MENDENGKEICLSRRHYEHQLVLTLLRIFFGAAHSGLLALQHTIPRRNSEKVSDPPNHMILDLASLTIGIDNVPENAEKFDAVVFIDEMTS
jgi:hypothetical protein